MNVHLGSLRHRPILDISTATTVGRVEHLVLDLSSASVLAIVVGRAADDRTILPWAAIKAVGEDAVTIDSSDALRTAGDEREARAASGETDPMGKKVLSDAGDELGVVTDLVIDSSSGAVVGMMIGDQPIAGDGLIGVGDYAAVVDQRSAGQATES